MESKFIYLFMFVLLTKRLKIKSEREEERGKQLRIHCTEKDI